MTNENHPASSSRNAGGAWQPPSIEDIQALFPQYEIVGLLGRGGMGAVFKGWQRSLERFVAIKILPPGRSDESQYSERFKQEARSMAKLSHPGIVAVFDAGETSDGMLYFVMEFIEGTDVQKMIAEQGCLPPAHAMAITAHVCDALQYAHDRNIIHRDIKPANIMVGFNGVVKVADFGLAKQHQEGVSGITQSGMMMGTLHYMAPESLILGVSVDHRADIYAVGIMLYQMLTGRLPQGLFEMPSQKVPGLDPRYDAAVSKAIREDRDIRYQSAAELRADLDSILTQPVARVDPAATQAPAALPTVARPRRPEGYVQREPQPVQRKSSSTGILLAAVLVLVAGGLFVFKDQLLPQTSPSLPAVAEDAKPKTETPTVATEPGQKTSGAAANVSTPSTATKPAGAARQVSSMMTAPADCFTNSLGMKFVPVPGTDILMCIHETRRQDYAAFAAEVADVKDFWTKQMCGGVPCGDKDDHPVVGVTWDESKQFCEWLSRKENRAYSLPKDEEWSRAVGIAHLESRSPGVTLEMLSQKEQTQFPWEGTFPPQTADRAGNYADCTWHEKFPDKPYFENYTDGFVTTSPVGSFKPNKLGLYDMGGNVWEWVEGWRNAEQKEHPNRGGGFFYNGGRANLLSSSRGFPPANSRYFNTGFRIVVRGMVAAASAATAAVQPVAPPSAPAVSPPTEPAVVPAAAAPRAATTPKVSVRLGPEMIFFGSKGKVSVIGKDGQVSDGARALPPPQGAVFTSKVFPGSVVRTGAGSSADLALVGGGSVRLDADSELRLPERISGRPTVEGLELLKGRLYVHLEAADITKAGRGQLKIKTPAATIAVQGAQCYVEIGATYETVGVFEGTVEVTESQAGIKAVVKETMSVAMKPGAISHPQRLGLVQAGLKKVCDEIELVRTELSFLTDELLTNTLSETYFFESGYMSNPPGGFFTVEAIPSRTPKSSGSLLVIKANELPKLKSRSLLYTPKIDLSRGKKDVIAIEFSCRSEGVSLLAPDVKGQDPDSGQFEITPFNTDVIYQLDRLIQIKPGDGKLGEWSNNIYPLYPAATAGGPKMTFIRPTFRIYMRKEDSYFVPGRAEYRLEFAPPVIITRKQER